MTGTLLRMIEVGSISTLFYKSASLMTYLTILLCKFDKGQVKTMKSLWKHDAEAPNYNANTCESFPLVGL